MQKGLVPDIKLLLMGKVIKQEFTRRHKWEFAKLKKVFLVVGYDDVAAACNRTLVLQEVFEIAHIIMSQCCVKLVSLAIQDSNTMSKTAYHIITQRSFNTSLNIIDICKTQERCIDIYLFIFP